MGETKPRSEQIRFISNETGSHILDEYLEAAERGGLTLGALMDVIFDPVGNINSTFIQFRLDEDPVDTYAFQYRIGAFVDPDAGWVTISDPVFQEIIDACVAARDAAQADAVQTAADRVQTGLDRAQTGLDVTASQLAAAQAAASANGLKPKGSTRAATTGALPACTYANGTAGVGATLTGNVNGALAAQDAITLADTEVLLVKNQVSAQHNGIYAVTQIGTAGTPFILTRIDTMDQWAEVPGATVVVEEGATQAERSFICTSNQGGTIGTTALTWQDQLASLVDGSVTASKIATDAVTTLKIQNDAVTNAKLALSGLVPIAGTSSTGAGLVLAEDTDNGTNTMTLKAPDNLAGDIVVTGPSATGTVALVGGDIGGATAATQSAGDNSTKVATTAYSDAAAASRAPLPSASGVGQVVNISTASGVGFSLPAGGTWFYTATRLNTSTFVWVGDQATGINIGGASVLTAVAGNAWRGFAWRIT